MDVNVGKSLKITRIDMTVNPDGRVFVCKYAEGWTVDSPATERYFVDSMTIEAMCAWLEERGWTVRRWSQSGARAWLGEVKAVRSSWQIKRMRDQYSERLQNRQPVPEGVQICSLNFALDM